MRTRPDECDQYECRETATEFEHHHGQPFQWCAKHSAELGQASARIDALESGDPLDDDKEEP